MAPNELLVSVEAKAFGKPVVHLGGGELFEYERGVELEDSGNAAPGLAMGRIWWLGRTATAVASMTVLGARTKLPSP
jgi:hypothetical protein